MKKLGLVAGGGELPLEVVKYCKNNNVELYCVLVGGFANKNNYINQNAVEIKIGQVGKAIKYFRNNGVRDVVFAGNVKKPHFGLMIMDFKGFLLLRDILKNKVFGDNTILETVVNFLKKYDLNIIEIDSILDNIKLSAGNNTSITCSEEYLEDVEIGNNMLKTISNFDVGQSAVVQQKNIIGIECFEGTKELILRCGKLKYNSGRKPVLVKIKKTNQTRKIDLPTIGVDTIEQVHTAGYAGIAVDYKNCIVLSVNKVIDLANKYNLFIYGID
ncbi:MAG: UDP-2,3-diacylglucosamine diphosphatase LpxI [Rickettsiales bacterium]|nr:UDP-2,3-diacylglucosamine diphosphatase LpxI [Rickettsiales bacterium]